MEQLDLKPGDLIKHHHPRAGVVRGVFVRYHSDNEAMYLTPNNKMAWAELSDIEKIDWLEPLVNRAKEYNA